MGRKLNRDKDSPPLLGVKFRTWEEWDEWEAFVESIAGGAKTHVARTVLLQAARGQVARANNARERAS